MSCQIMSALVLLVALSTSAVGQQEIQPIARERPEADAASTAPKLVLETGGFTTAINSLEFSPDGKWLAAAGADKTVRIWDLGTGRLLTTLRGHSEAGGIGACSALAVSPDRRSLVVGVTGFAPEGTIRVYETADFGRIAQLLPAHQQGGVVALAFSEDGRYLASAGADGQILFWDWPARRLLRRVPLGGTSVTYFAFPIRGVPILAVLDARGAHIWSVLHGKEWQDLNGGEQQDFLKQVGDPQAMAAFLQRMMVNLQALATVQIPGGGIVNKGRTYLDSGYLLQGGLVRGANRDRYWVGLWSAANKGSLVHLHEKHQYIPTAMALAPRGDLVASGDYLGNIHVWASRTGAVRWKLTGAGRPVYRVAFDAGTEPGYRLAFGTTPHGKDKWGRNHYGELEQTFDLKEHVLRDGAPGAHNVELASLHGRTLSVRRDSPSGRFFLDCARDGRAESSLPFSDDLPMCFGLLRSQEPGFPDPVVVGTINGSIDAYDPRTLMQRRMFGGHLGAVMSVSESPDGRYLATGSTDRTARIWKLGRFPDLGWPDFYTQSDGTIYHVIPGGQSERAGVRGDDRLLAIDGKDITTLVGLLVQNRWPFPVGHRATLDLKRGEKPYRVELPLSPGPDFAEPLLSLFATADGEWVLWTQEGYYDASLGGDRLIGWHVNQGRDKAAKFYLAQQFRKQFYRPDVIDRALETGDVMRAVVLAGAERPRPEEPLDIRRPDVLPRIEPPRVRILAPLEGATTRTPRITLRAAVESQNSRPVREVTFLVNGRPTADRSVARDRSDDRPATSVVEREVSLLPGTNELSVLAANDASTSQPARVSVTYKAAAASEVVSKPKLYLLAVGIARYTKDEFNLRFADKDAREFAASWRGQEGQVYTKVETRVLTDEQATNRAILEGMEWLVRSATQRDVTVLFLSAHGFRDERQNYYLATHEVDPASLRSTGLRWSEVKNLIQDLPGKFLLFADTCHSGGITGAKGLADDPLRELVLEDTGAVVFSSSLPREVSLEDPRWGHGAFTKAFLDVTNDPASDLNHDGYLSLSELNDRISERVKSLTSGRQHTAVEWPPTISNFNFYRINAAP